MVSAHPDLLTVEGRTGRAVVAVDGPRDGKVGIVIGGGSGHEPAFAGYVGRGLADAAAVGNVFASPSPEQIMDAARAADGGAGVVFLYGNYTGDVLNFDMAVEECAAAGILARSVAVADDVASARPPAPASGAASPATSSSSRSPARPPSLAATSTLSMRRRWRLRPRRAR